LEKSLAAIPLLCDGRFEQAMLELHTESNPGPTVK